VVEQEMLIPKIDYDLCMDCGMCITSCNPAAISWNEEGRPEVNEVACRSCGMCMPACPTGAIQLLNFRDDQLLDEIVPISGGGVVCIE